MTWSVRRLVGVCGVLSLSPVLLESQSASRGATAASASAAKPSAPATRDSLEEAPFAARLTELRAQLLARSGWADLGDRCNPGALRVFPADTTTASQEEIQKMFGRMEELIILLGVGASVDDADGRTLVRTVLEWEGGVSRPAWDTDDGKRRMALATGLTGEYPDPTSDKCLSAPRTSDTVTFVVPALTDITFKSAPPIQLKAFLTSAGYRRARDDFVSRHGATTTASLEYIAIAPVVRWHEWAVVSVNRPVEEGGVMIGKSGKGGATYLLRRVGAEWRLFGISRTWGR